MVGAVCVVRGCYNRGISTHRFPNPAKDITMFNRWLNIIDSEELRNMTPMVVFNNRRVCRHHFADDQFGPNNKLLRTAYPKLNLQTTLSYTASDNDLFINESTTTADTNLTTSSSGYENQDLGIL